jgi:hypothetical protein
MFRIVPLVLALAVACDPGSEDTSDTTDTGDTAVSVEVTLDAPGSAVRGVVTLTADVVEAVDVIELRVDGVLVKSGPAPLSFDWDTTAVADGPHDVVATALLAGEEADEASAIVTTDNAAPAVASTEPADGAPDLDVAEPIVVTFDEPLVGDGAFHLSSAAGELDIDFASDDEGSTWTITLLEDPTLPGTLELAADGFTDALGNPLDATLASWDVSAWLVDALPGATALDAPTVVDAASAPNGDALVAFRGISAGGVVRYHAGAWQALPGLNASVSSVAFTADSAPLAVQPIENGQLEVLKHDGDGWVRIGQPVGATNAPNYRAQLSVGPDGRIWLAWLIAVPAGSSNVQLASSIGSDFTIAASEISAYSGSFTDANDPDVLVASNGVVWLTWAERRSASAMETILVTTYTPPGRRGNNAPVQYRPSIAPNQPDATAFTAPSLAQGSDGTVYVAAVRHSDTVETEVYAVSGTVARVGAPVPSPSGSFVYRARLLSTPDGLEVFYRALANSAEALHRARFDGAAWVVSAPTEAHAEPETWPSDPHPFRLDGHGAMAFSEDLPTEGNQLYVAAPNAL